MIDPGAPTLPSGPLVDFQAVRDAINSVKLIDKRVLKLIRSELRRLAKVDATFGQLFQYVAAVDNRGTAIGTNGFAAGYPIAFACSLVGVQMFSPVAGNVPSTFWRKRTMATPDAYVSLLGPMATVPALSSAASYEDFALFDWPIASRTFVPGDVLDFGCNGPITTITRLAIVAVMQRATA